MAKRSATETSAIIDILARRGQAPADKLQPIQELIIRVVSMLTKLAAKSHAGSGTGTGTGTGTGAGR